MTSLDDLIGAAAKRHHINDQRRRANNTAIFLSNARDFFGDTLFELLNITSNGVYNYGQAVYGKHKLMLCIKRGELDGRTGYYVRSVHHPSNDHIPLEIRVFEEDIELGRDSFLLYLLYLRDLR